jgi:hypothetical protein
MRTLVRCCLLAVAVLAALLMPSLASAYDLTGSVDVSWLYPNTSTVLETGTDNVGSVLTCPGPASTFCSSGLNTYLTGNGVSWSFDVESSTIAFTASAPDGVIFLPATFNGFSFSDLMFADGASLGNFGFSTDISGLTASNVTFGSNFIDVNLQDAPTDGAFTLTLIPTPEPGSAALFGLGLIGLIVLARGRAKSLRRPTT